MELITATRKHFQAICRLVKTQEELFLISPSSHYPWCHQQLTNIVAHRSNPMVGIIDDRVVAFANLYDVEKNQSAFIGNIVVDPQLRNRGLGKSLTLYMMDICMQEHNAKPHLSVFSYNTNALLMYHHLGFVPYQMESRRNYKNDTVALIHMRHEG